MAKFMSLDGKDEHGWRAEVSVQTGSGRIKEINPKGNPQPDGTYRNMEIVFDPDNPHLKRKVYAMLDTTSKNLWQKIQTVHDTQQTVEYRIESVRRRNVDRKIPFQDLKHTEEAVRILAAIDDVFSHEARTDPQEDPSTGQPSALAQRLAHGEDNQGATSATATSHAASVPFDSIVNMIEAPDTVFPSIITADALQAVRLNTGEPFTAKEYDTLCGLVEGSGYGTTDMTVALSLEQYALTYLTETYEIAPGQTSDEVFAQAAGMVEELFRITDTVYTSLTGEHVGNNTPRLRASQAYKNIVGVVEDTIVRRYRLPFLAHAKQGSPPSAEHAEEIARWRGNVISVATQRCEMMKSLVAGLETLNPPQPPPEKRKGNTPTPGPLQENNVVEVENVAVEDSADVDSLLIEELGAEAIAPTPYPDFVTVTGAFVAPSPELIERLKNLCVEADVIGRNTEISDWLEKHLNHRHAKTVNADNLERFIAYYENEGSQKVRTDILG